MFHWMLQRNSSWLDTWLVSMPKIWVHFLGRIPTTMETQTISNMFQTAKQQWCFIVYIYMTLWHSLPLISFANTSTQFILYYVYTLYIYIWHLLPPIQLWFSHGFFGSLGNPNPTALENRGSSLLEILGKPSYGAAVGVVVSSKQHGLFLKWWFPKQHGVFPWEKNGGLLSHGGTPSHHPLVNKSF